MRKFPRETAVEQTFLEDWLAGGSGADCVLLNSVAFVQRTQRSWGQGSQLPRK
jgi:hypothetical protein